MDKSDKPQSDNLSKKELLMQMVEIQRNTSAFMISAQESRQAGDFQKSIINYEKQLEYGKRNLDLALLHNEHYHPPVEVEPVVQVMVDSMLSLADTLQSICELNRADNYRVEAVKLSENYLSLLSQIDVNRALAVSFINQGNFNEALTVLSGCRDSLIQMNEPVSVIRVTIDMADLLIWLGDFQKSLYELEIASDLLHSSADMKATIETDGSLLKTAAQVISGEDFDKNVLDSTRLTRAALEINYYRALTYKLLCRYDQAEALFSEILPAYEKMGVGAAIEFQFAAITLAKGDYRKTLDYSQHLIAVFKNNATLKPKLAALFKLQAEAFHHLLFNEDALLQLDHGIQSLTQEYYDPDELWKLYHLKGQIFSSTGNLQKALDVYIKGAGIVYNMRRAPLGFQLDSAFLRDKYTLFIEGISLACSLKEGNECCSLMEMIKSRTLAAILSIPAGKNGSACRKDRVSLLANELEAIEYKASHGEIAANEIRKREVQLKKERDHIVNEIRVSAPRWRNMTEPAPFDINSVTDLLAKNKYCALNLFYCPERIISVLIAERECLVSAIELDDKVKLSLKAYLENFNNKENRINHVLFDASASLSLGAHHLIAPYLIDRALKCEGIIIIPHGPLHLLPWACLVYNGRRLFESCPVSVLPNLNSIGHLSCPVSEKTSIAIIGAPDYKNVNGFEKLPMTEAECKEIHNLYSAERVIGKMVIGKESTVKAFWELAQQKISSGSILHIACQGITEPEEPMRSELIFSDGIINASEIASGSISYDEVILGDCCTGCRSMKVKDSLGYGDEILGLPGAFLEAGSRSVLACIQPVDIKVGSKFMINYHKHRSEGKSPMKALQLTQKFMSENTEFKPYEWVGFTLYGCQ